MFDFHSVHFSENFCEMFKIMKFCAIVNVLVLVLVLDGIVLATRLLTSVIICHSACILAVVYKMSNCCLCQLRYIFFDPECSQATAVVITEP